MATCPTPPPATIGRSPDAWGLTGLDTFLWADDQAPILSTGSVRGYAVPCLLEPVRWTWTTGDGASYTTDSPGGPRPNAAASHLYETKDRYTMDLTVDWDVLTPYGATTTQVSTSRPYQVREVRSVLSS